MNRLIDEMVLSELVTDWRLATCPASRSPVFDIATTEGVSRPPSALGMTTGSPPSMTATTEFVVPRSIRMTLSAILNSGLVGWWVSGLDCDHCRRATFTPVSYARPRRFFRATLAVSCLLNRAPRPLRTPLYTSRLSSPAHQP